MIAASVATRSSLPHSPVWRFAGSMGVTLAGLWAIQAYPAAGGVFAPLTVFTARLTAAMLAVIGLPVTREAATLFHIDGFACEIDMACTALIPVALLAAGMVSLRPRFIGIILGMTLVVLVNQLRLVSLVWLGVHAPEYLDMAHQLLWPALLILMAMGYVFVWLRITNR